MKNLRPSPRNNAPQLPFDRTRVAARSTWPAQHKTIVIGFSHPFPRQRTEAGCVAIFDPCDRDGHLLKTQLDLIRKRKQWGTHADGYRARCGVDEDSESPTQYAGARLIVQASRECGTAATDRRWGIDRSTLARNTMYPSACRENACRISIPTVRTRLFGSARNGTRIGGRPEAGLKNPQTEVCGLLMNRLYSVIA